MSFFTCVYFLHQHFFGGRGLNLIFICFLFVCFWGFAWLCFSSNLHSCCCLKSVSSIISYKLTSQNIYYSLISLSSIFVQKIWHSLEFLSILCIFLFVSVLSSLFLYLLYSFHHLLGFWGDYVVAVLCFLLHHRFLFFFSLLSHCLILILEWFYFWISSYRYSTSEQNSYPEFALTDNY